MGICLHHTLFGLYFMNVWPLTYLFDWSFIEYFMYATVTGLTEGGKRTEHAGNSRLCQVQPERKPAEVGFELTAAALWGAPGTFKL